LYQIKIFVKKPGGTGISCGSAPKPFIILKLTVLNIDVKHRSGNAGISNFKKLQLIKTWYHEIEVSSTLRI